MPNASRTRQLAMKSGAEAVSQSTTAQWLAPCCSTTAIPTTVVLGSGHQIQSKPTSHQRKGHHPTAYHKYAGSIIAIMVIASLGSSALINTSVRFAIDMATHVAAAPSSRRPPVEVTEQEGLTP